MREEEREGGREGGREERERGERREVRKGYLKSTTGDHAQNLVFNANTRFVYTYECAYIQYTVYTYAHVHVVCMVLSFLLLCSLSHCGALCT